MTNNYTIIENEVVQHVFTVEATSLEEAIKKHKEGTSELNWSSGGDSEMIFAEKEEV